MTFPLSGRRVWVAGHRGMVGQALVRRLESEDCEVLTAGRDELDLRDAAAVRNWLARKKPDTAIIAAATVGGIHANASRPWDFLHDNLAIATATIDGARRTGAERLLFLGSSCIYPKHAEQPIREEALLTGPLEPTNEAYAVAKIAGLKLVEAARAQHGLAYVSAMPTNLYGPGDNFHPTDSHVIPGILRRAHDRKTAGERDLPIWGTGAARREFLHVDDCADALVKVLTDYEGPSHINVGTGEDIPIREVADMVMDVVGLEGEVLTDPSKPDGTPRKLLDVSRLSALGWRASTPLREGLESTYRWFLRNRSEARL